MQSARFDDHAVRGIRLARRASSGLSMIRAPNVLTLSCKSRPPHRGSPGGAAAAATNMQWRERDAADVTPAVQLEPPEAAPPPGQRSGGFCQLVRAVSPPDLL